MNSTGGSGNSTSSRREDIHFRRDRAQDDDDRPAELVDRILRYANLMGRENVIARVIAMWGGPVTGYWLGEAQVFGAGRGDGEQAALGVSGSPVAATRSAWLIRSGIPRAFSLTLTLSRWERG